MTLAWIPNTLTMGNLLLGFISLFFSSSGEQHGYVIAGFLILAAGLLDGFDGRVARALKVDGPLGRELDSLADCVAFGVAPGYLAYKAYLSGMEFLAFGFVFDLGILIASIFPLCAAYRLARFNITTDNTSFSGLPSPVAGIIIALFPLYFESENIHVLVFAAVFVIIALLMVSTVKYSKPNSDLLQKLQGIKLVLLILLIILLIIFFKKWVIIIFLGIYIMTGIVSFVIQFIQEYRY